MSSGSVDLWDIFQFLYILAQSFETENLLSQFIDSGGPFLKKLWTKIKSLRLTRDLVL
jgi:hypothetical protein